MNRTLAKPGPGPRTACFLKMAACGLLLSTLPAPRAAAQRDAGDELFANAAIRHLSIEISEEDMAILRAPVARNRNVSVRPSVPATVREGDLVWTNVAVHLKGSFGSFRRVDDKPALTLNFDKHVEKQRFHGLEKISLNNSVQDPSFVSEKICREMYTAAGVPVPRVDYATAELNGRQLGLFVLAEGWNKQFLRRHFQNVKGNFYDLGGNRDVNTPMEADFGQSVTNHAALEAVTVAMNEPDHSKRLRRLRETVDLDRLISLHALDVLMWNWDGYGMNRNNYRLFHDLGAGRVVFLPHGVDQMFWKANGPIVTGRSGLVVKSILETAEGRRLYLERFHQLRTNVFDLRTATNRIAELTIRLQPALKKHALFAAAMQQQSAADLSGKIVSRLQDVDRQLSDVRRFSPLPLNDTAPLTNWVPLASQGDAAVTNVSNTLRVRAQDGSSLGGWATSMWLEEGRYRVEGRVKTFGVESESRQEGGAGFRVWSDRKDTRGASWSWFPYGNSRDTRLGRIIPVATDAPQQRLSGNTEWTTVTHEFELRQPLADVQIHCVLGANFGAAWFDLPSLRIRRVALNVSKSTARGD